MGLTRGIDTTLLTALAGHFHPVSLMQAVWPDETIRCHTGFGTITWASETWDGLGHLVGLRAPQEGLGLARQAATIQMAVTLDIALAQQGRTIRNSDVTVWAGATTTPGGNVLIGQPFRIYTGYCDARRITLRADGGDLSHDVAVDLMPGPGARDGLVAVHSPERQEAAYPGDTGARHFVNAVKRSLNPPAFPGP